MMKPRERVIRALNYQETDRPPFQATFVPEFADKLRAAFGLPPMFSEPHHREWYGYDLEILTGQDALQASCGWVTNYYLDNKPYTDEWGVRWRIDEYETPQGKGYYTNIDVNPLRDDEAAIKFKAPDPNKPGMYDVVERLVKTHGDEYWIIGRIHTTIFESAWALRGMEQLMMDFYLNPGIADHIIEETFQYHLEVARNLARTGVDMIWLGDDFGAQDSLIIDPELWRSVFKHRFATIISEAKRIKPGIKIAYHTDGCNYDIVEDLIEIGLDILNPIQTECMDPVFMEEKYGGRLCFFGGIAVQSTLPNGTFEELKAEYKWLKNTLGKGGGWICAPTHHVQLDTTVDKFFNLLKILGIEDKRK